MQNSAQYIVFDGMDGSGKGTQLRLLGNAFPFPVLFTREPGGTPFAEEIRKLVRNNPLAGESTPLNHLLLFWAAREELQQNLIVPALRAGKQVFSDRGDSSTFAFQLCGEEHEQLLDLFLQVRKCVFDARRGRRQPDRYIIFDLPAEMARARALQDATRTRNHFDVRALEYYERVRKGFLKFAELQNQPVDFVDATRSIEDIHLSVIRILTKELGAPKNAHS